jgi:hypothetical protein
MLCAQGLTTAASNFRESRCGPWPQPAHLRACLSRFRRRCELPPIRQRGCQLFPVASLFFSRFSKLGQRLGLVAKADLDGALRRAGGQLRRFV